MHNHLSLHQFGVFEIFLFSQRLNTLYAGWTLPALRVRPPFRSVAGEHSRIASPSILAARLNILLTLSSLASALPEVPSFGWVVPPVLFDLCTTSHPKECVPLTPRARTTVQRRHLLLTFGVVYFDRWSATSVDWDLSIRMPTVRLSC